MRTKLTLLNAITSILNMLISSILSLVATRTVLVYLGSDYNGLNSTITQFVSLLLLVESGFTLAALIRLYAPYGKNDWQQVNRILTKTRLTLKKIGLYMLLIGILGAAIYALSIDSEIEYFIIVLLFVISISSTAFNFAYVYKYRLVFQVTQHEYLLHIVSIFQNILIYGGMIVAVQTTHNIILARLIFLFANVLGGFFISLITRKRFPWVSYKEPCKDVQIEGTKDLFITKLVGVLYNSLTVFYMSVFVGTVQTSVYAVYYSAVSLISNLIDTALVAPQNALGQIINTERERTKDIVHEYEFTAVLVTTILFSTTLALIIPFIRLYTMGVNDVNYIQPQIAILLVLIAVLQIIHIPSGRCIELSGDFKTVRNIQLTTFFMLVVFSFFGGLRLGLNGLLLAKLIATLALAFMEIRYTHKKILRTPLKNYTSILIPNLIAGTIVAGMEFLILINISLTWSAFLLTGIALVFLNGLFFLAFGYLLYNKEIKALWNRYSRFLHMKTASK